MNTFGLVPLINFGHIDKTIYRSAQPEYAYQYRWLQKNLHLGGIANLRAEMPFADSKFLLSPQSEIQEFLFLVKDHYAPTLEQAKEFMGLVRDHVQKGKDLLVHCLHGHGRTSTFSILAKLAMGWSFPKAYNDERDRFHYSFKHKAQDGWLFENQQELAKL